MQLKQSIEAHYPHLFTLELSVQDKRIAELEATLRPFASAAYNDNGDVTISTGHIRTEDWLRAKRAIFN